MNDEARCPRHPGNPVVSVCSRCGTFLCSEDLRLLDAKHYCAECVVRPDVDYLEAFRMKYWGRRDGWAWMVGFGSLINLAAAVWAGIAIAQGQVMIGLETAAIGLIGTVICAGFFFGQKWARLAFLGLPVLSAVIGAATGGAGGALPAVMPFLFALAIYSDGRNQLFFKVEVPRTRLKKMWDLYANNTLARTGLMLGISGLLLPVLSPFALALSIVGLSRVDPNAHPPIGRKGQAIAGIVLGGIGLIWGVALAVTIFA